MSGDSRSVDFRLAVAHLHKAKDAAYRSSRKRRGESISIIANIARKIDRLEAVIDGAPATPDESVLDTAIDLLVYTLKYQTFLADHDTSVARILFDQGHEVEPPYSDGTDGFEALLTRADLTLIDIPQSQSLGEATARVLSAFAAVEVAVTEPVAAVSERANNAAALAAAAINLLGTLRRDAPEGYDDFIATTLEG